MSEALTAELLAIGWEAGLTLGMVLGVAVPVALRAVLVPLAGVLTATDHRRDRIARARARAAVRHINRVHLGRGVELHG